MNKIQNSRVLFLGIDGVGKTTLLYLLKLNELVTTIPTIGFNVEEIKYKDRKITIFDLRGGGKIKPLWKHYMPSTKCILYLINISDKERFNYYLECFNELLEQKKEFGNIQLIIFANKFNDKIEFEPEELLSKSNLPPEISPYIIKGNIIKKEGLEEFLEYIYNNIEFEEIDNNNKDEEEPKLEQKLYKVLMLGLDDSGKTTILFLFKYKEEITTFPTIGFNVEVIKYPKWENNISFWGIGGLEEIRPL